MKNLLFFLCFFLTGIIIQAQSSSRADSLQKLLEKEESDTGRIVLSYRLAYELQYSDPEKSELITHQALEESQKLNFPKGTANSKIQLGNLELIKGNNETATQYYLDALDILTRANIKEGITVCYNNLGIIAHNTNNYSKANEYYRRSLSINRELGRKSGEATALYCIGTVFENQAKYDSALKYYFEAQTISEAIPDERLIAYGKSSLANVYFIMKNYPKAMEYYRAAVALFEAAGNKYGSLKMYISLGQTAAEMDSTETAIDYYDKALKISVNIESLNDEAFINYAMAQLLEYQGDLESARPKYEKACNIYKSIDSKDNIVLALVALARLKNLSYEFRAAEKYLEEAEKIAKEINSVGSGVDIYRELSMSYTGLNDFKKAFYYLNRYTELKDSLMNVEKQKQILELQTQYETDKKEKENEILRKDRKILQTTRNSLIIGALLLAIIIIVVLRSLTIKKRDNRILKEQKDEINRQKEIVESQKTSITDSIKYARRIQSAMLTPDESVNQYLANSFVLYLPRDIVSGDFYWLRKLNDNMVLVCVADCTGHGVPGAFMSMLGMSLLNDIISVKHTLIINNEFRPSDILNELRERVKSSLRQTGKEGEARDGMDLSMCLVDREAGVLSYSGANNSVYIVTNGTLTELKATRNPIGIYLNEISFSDHVLEVIPDSIVYMFSDGYSDQIGKEGAKFLSKNFKRLLAEISSGSPSEIREILHKRHLDWRDGEEQVDDILVLGFRL
jgi:serine phosphatase RsbU (regulator of sigma subunit)